MPGRQPADAMTVLIVGGGYGGCVLAPKLEKAGFDVTLIERCECFFHKIGGGKAAVAPGYETKVTIPLSKLPVSKVLWAEATELDMSRKTLRVRHGGSGLFSYLPFDFLVIAVGQSHGFGQLPDRMLARDEILSFLRSEQSRVKQAQSVTIIGGGALGVETAAQVRQSHPATPVTLVHSSPQLMSAVQPPLSAAFASTLADLKAKLGKVKVCKGSTLILQGEGIEVKNLWLDGSLKIKACPGAKVVVDGPRVKNSTYKWSGVESVAEGDEVDEVTAIRGFKVVPFAGPVLEFNEPGNYVVTDLP